ncbi:hypothetical protein ABMY35_09315 [Pseudoalteromonas sp. BZB3]|uniref:hypothetical protein n=1 Tax=Pseudoalteromonas sp. BZB3 TaxID=3136670 RepID=UPI0032C49E56
MEGISSIIFDQKYALNHYEKLLLFIFLVEIRTDRVTADNLKEQGYPSGKLGKSITKLVKLGFVERITDRRFNYRLSDEYSEVGKGFEANNKCREIIFTAHKSKGSSKNYRTATKLVLIYFLLKQQKYISISAAELAKEINVSLVNTKTAIKNLINEGFLHCLVHGRTFKTNEVFFEDKKIDCRDLFELKQTSTYYFSSSNKCEVLELPLASTGFSRKKKYVTARLIKIIKAHKSSRCERSNFEDFVMQQYLSLNEESQTDFEELHRLLKRADEVEDYNFWSFLEEIALYVAGRALTANDASTSKIDEFLSEINIFSEGDGESDNEKKTETLDEKQSETMKIKNQLYSLFELIGRFFILLYKDYLKELEKIQLNNTKVKGGNEQSIPRQGDFILAGIEESMSRVNPNGVLIYYRNYEDGLVYEGFFINVKYYKEPKQLQSNHQSSNLKEKWKVSNVLRVRPRSGLSL